MSSPSRVRPSPRTRVCSRRQVAGTNVAWDQAAKILPIDPQVAAAVLELERAFEGALEVLERQVAHLPSRVRSLLWILCSLPIMAARGHEIAPESEVRAELYARLPALRTEAAQLVAAIA